MLKNSFFTLSSPKLFVNPNQLPIQCLLLFVIVSQTEVFYYFGCLLFDFKKIIYELNLGEICYSEGEEQKEIQMGLSEVCQGETTFVKVRGKCFFFKLQIYSNFFLKDPSAQVDFGKKSVSNLCSFLNISIIYRVLSFLSSFLFFLIS